MQVRSRCDWEAFWLDGPQVDVHPPAPWRTGLIYDETRETRRWIFPSLKDWWIDEAHRRHNVGLRGHIALQLHTKDELRIQYKDILVRPLNGGVPRPTPAKVPT